jgi:uncharacterized protein (TIGR03067 family)
MKAARRSQEGISASPGKRVGHVRFTILISAVLATAFAPAPKQASATKDLRRMQGDWVRSSRSIGKNVREDGALRVRIDGDRLSYSRGKAELGSWRISLGKAGKLRTVDKFTTGENGRKYRWLGVYEFRGASMVVCWTEWCDDPDRPRGFEPMHDVEVEVYTRPAK